MLKSFEKKQCVMFPYENMHCIHFDNLDNKARCDLCDFYYRIMKNRDQVCTTFNNSFPCSCSHDCLICEFFEEWLRLSREIYANELIFIYTDVLRKTEKGGGLDYLYKPLILKPEAMERLGIEVELYNQIFIPTSGAGMFSNFPGSQFDGYILNDRRKIYTISRHDVYGVANEAAVKRYKDLFLIDLHKEARKGAMLMI